MNKVIDYKEANAELIVRCKRGEETAFGELYQLYSKAMFNVCVRMLGNTNDAQDVLQESFIAAFRNIGQYKEKASFGSWLKRIVINRCIDTVKKRNFDTIPLDAINDRSEMVDELYEDTYLTIENVLKAINLLPDGYRVILTLYLFEEYSHKMIAEKLGITEGTSKSQYSRAKKKLLELIILNIPAHE